MVSQREAREYHSAIVDLTDHCKLRCRNQCKALERCPWGPMQGFLPGSVSGRSRSS